MHNLSQLKVYTLAREILHDIHQLSIPEFGDLRNQIQRATISIVSNIAEGAGSNSDKQFIKFLGYAKASNNEVLAQFNILKDIRKIGEKHKIFKQLDILGAMLYRLIQSLRKE